MQYILLIYGNEAAMQSATESQVAQMVAAYGAYSEALKKAGVPDLDAALSWAARCPGANAGTIEVRPIWAM